MAGLDQFMLFYNDKTLLKLVCGNPVEMLCLRWGKVFSPLMKNEKRKKIGKREFGLPFNTSDLI